MKTHERECITHDDKVIPPRTFMKETYNCDNSAESWDNAWKYSNLKPVLARSVHPSSLMQETNVLIAMEATHSHDPEFCEVNRYRKFIYRTGR